MGYARNCRTRVAEVLPSGDTIELRCRGPEQQILLGVVADEIDAMNANFNQTGVTLFNTHRAHRLNIGQPHQHLFNPIHFQRQHAIFQRSGQQLRHA